MYRRSTTFRIILRAFTMGLAGVYMWNCILIWLNEIPVDLPKVHSGENVLFVFPYVHPSGAEAAAALTKRIIDGRDLSLFDLGGYVADCEPLIVPDDETRSCLSRREVAKTFIYDHLRQKRRGYVSVGFPCVDCGPVYHFFIEPHMNDRWGIAATLDTNGPLRTSHAVKIRFRPATHDEVSHGNPSRILALIDQFGNEIVAF